MRKKDLTKLAEGLAWLCFSSDVRIQKLEQLCRDMYSWEIVLTGEYKTAFLECFKDRMTDLGLLEGEQND